MKKLFALLISSFTFLVCPASAQILLYGDGGFDLDKSTGSSSVRGTANFNPSIAWHVNAGAGYVLNDKLTLGLLGGYSHINNLAPSSYSQNSNSANLPTYALITWSAGAFGRYTKHLGDHFFIYAQTDLSIFQSVYKRDGGLVSGTLYNTTIYDSQPEGTGVTAFAFPGFGIDIYKGLGVQANIGGISYTYFNNFDGFATHHINISLGQQFNFGVYKFFAHHKDAAKKNASTPE